ncbi:hypothetical protein DSO57_1031868 [Entomophthora muscae]|uniref:Uncharacterized protein n=1 Tax=Entomophthora muscae TaxID=34485 RepID=A0ACC2RFB5_9FUNG|nr:hypothetical protein DSO57_1031868 [Entomophthora muscae]
MGLEQTIIQIFKGGMSHTLAAQAKEMEQQAIFHLAIGGPVNGTVIFSPILYTQNYNILDLTKANESKKALFPDKT